MGMATKGYVMPMWSYNGPAAAQAAMSAAKATGANSVEIDFNFTTGPGLYQSNSVSIENSPHNTLGELSQAISIAKGLGLSVWVKPQLEVGTDHSNSALLNNWAAIAPTDPHGWFQQYTAALKTLGSTAQAAGADHFILTNELRSMTNNPAYVSEWTNLFQEVRTVFKGPIGFNAGAFWNFGKQEYEGIPDAVVGQLDFMGLSAYPRFGTDTTTTESVAQVQAGWTKDYTGRNTLNEIHTWQANHPGKPLYFTELGSPETAGGYNGLQKGGAHGNYQDMANYMLGSLSTVQVNAPEVRGAFIYEWSMNGSGGTWDVSTSPIVTNALNQGWHYA
jgi:hypothetical protein